VFVTDISFMTVIGTENKIGLEPNDNGTVGLEGCVLVRNLRNDNSDEFHVFCISCNTVIVKILYLVIQVISLKYL
jgi:hypothetical protein